MFPRRPKHALAGVFLSFTAITTGCTVTHVTAPAPADCLKRVAEAAAADWTVNWVNDKHLEISDAWVWGSIFSIGYTRFRADLEYANGQLDGDFYLKTNSLAQLFIPCTHDTGSAVGLERTFLLPDLSASLARPTMRGQMEDILGWAGVAKDGRTVKHVRR